MTYSNVRQAMRSQPFDTRVVFGFLVRHPFVPWKTWQESQENQLSSHVPLGDIPYSLFIGKKVCQNVLMWIYEICLGTGEFRELFSYGYSSCIVFIIVSNESGDLMGCREFLLWYPLSSCSILHEWMERDDGKDYYFHTDATAPVDASWWSCYKNSYQITSFSPSPSCLFWNQILSDCHLIIDRRFLKMELSSYRMSRGVQMRAGTNVLQLVLMGNPLRVAFTWRFWVRTLSHLS